MDLVRWAADLAQQCLAEPLPRRWAHSQGVSRATEELGPVFGSDAQLLTAAGWLHDLGYAPKLVRTGLHGLDGALYLRDVVGAEPRLCSLVAYHSCAHVEARHRGLLEQLEAEFTPQVGDLADALTYCDMTTSPDGHPVRAEDRLAEILRRYGPDHVVFRAISEARPEILRAVESVRGLRNAAEQR